MCHSHADGFKNTYVRTLTGGTASLRSGISDAKMAEKGGVTADRRHWSSARQHLKAGSKQTSRIFIDYRIQCWMEGGVTANIKLEKKMSAPQRKDVFEENCSKILFVWLKLWFLSAIIKSDGEKEMRQA